MTRILDKKVTPSNCTLAIALPLTREEFFADLQPNVPKDYAKFFCSQIWEKPGSEGLWIKYRDNISNLISGVADEVRKLGVKVIPNLTLADLPSIFDRDIVTIVSHWRGSDIEFDDFIDFQLFADKLKNSSNNIIFRIRQKLSAKVIAQIKQVDSVKANKSLFQKELINELNDLLRHENFGQMLGFVESETEQPLRMEHRTYFNRIALESVFENELKKGNKVEFFDSLESSEAIRDKIPDSFTGLLNLIICNSVLPAESIKLMKRNCLILSNQKPAKPSFRLLEYKAIIRALHNEPNTFINTMKNIRENLGNYLINQ